MSIHAHKILNMMTGHSYTESELIQAIEAQFGHDALFHTCSAQGLNPHQIVEFLKQKGKFLPTNENQFTVNKNNVCDHDED